MIEFVVSVLFGCYSSVAIDEIITEKFDLTEMQEQIENETCFYGWVSDVNVTEVYKKFVWSDGDKMVVLKGKAPNGDSIYFWTSKEKFDFEQGKHLGEPA